jgi:preprotein translocase subunit SecD
MEFSKVDADNFYEMTKKYTQQQMAIMIDDVVFSDPNIKEPIPGGRVRIELGRSFGMPGPEGGQRPRRRAASSGALQAPLRKVYDSQIGPTLGADSIEDGKMSVMVGFLGVALFMILYYGLSGVVANIALAYNVLLTLALMSAFGATLTLPGIAGIVLTRRHGRRCERADLRAHPRRTAQRTPACGSASTAATRWPSRPSSTRT